MIKFLGFLLFLTVHVSGKPRNDIDPHVVGGTQAQEGSFPAVVSLRYKNTKQLMCGGSFVSDLYILTAGHCLEGKSPSEVLVAMGSVHLKNQKFLEPEKFLTHPRWNSVTFAHDIGLIKLKKPVEFTDDFQPLKFTYSKNVDNKQVTAAGWGRTGANLPPSPDLLYLKKKVLSQADCVKAFNNSMVKDYHVCFSGEKNYGMCMGDSGGPLMLNEEGETYVIGVVSWGIPCAVGFPDAFTRVSKHVDWLKKVVKKTELDY